MQSYYPFIGPKHKARKTKFQHTRRDYQVTLRALLLLRANWLLQKFTVCTDHDALEWILTLPDSTGRLYRWILRLSKFNFDVGCRARVKNQDVDAMAQFVTTGTDKTLDKDDIQELILVFSQCLDRPKYAAFAPDYSKAFGRTVCSNLIPCSHGQDKVAEVQSRTFAMNESSILNRLILIG